MHAKSVLVHSRGNQTAEACLGRRTAPGEISNSWAFLLRSLRDQAVTGCEIEAAIRQTPIIIEAKPAYRSYRDEVGDTLMPFGKYQRVPLQVLPEDYLKFLLDNHRAGKMKTKIEIWLARK